MVKSKKKNKVIVKPSAEPKDNKNIAWIVLGIILLMVAIIRIRLLGMPLERDEGEYAYMGQLILRGIPPYKIAYNMKFPGTYAMYAFFMSIFGQTGTGIHLGLLIVNLAAISLLFLLVKKLINNYAGLTAAAVYAIMSVSYPAMGFAGHATHFVIVFALGGTLLLYKAVTEDNSKLYLWSGILLGLAPVMKQPGIFFPMFGGVFLLVTMIINRRSGFKDAVRKIIYFITGAIVPLIVMLLVLKVAGVFDKFWYWTIDYAMLYENMVGFGEAVHKFNSTFIPLFIAFYPIWIVAVLGLVALFLHPKLKKDIRILFVALFFVFSLLSIFPGYYFRSHYYITLFPAIAMLFGIFVDYILELSKAKYNLVKIKYVSYGLLIFAVASGIIYQYDYLFESSPNEICKRIYDANPFIESVEIAKYIEANSNKDDKIAVLGSEPEIFFYANRLSASGYIYTYSLMEDQKNYLVMQKEMINEIQTAMPKYFVYVNVSASWMLKPNSDHYIFSWTGPFLRSNDYKLIGMIDIYPDRTIYKWDNETSNYRIGSEDYIVIYKRMK